MKNTILELFDFQLSYILKLVDNIPDNMIYDLQLKGINSPGWILGHLIVEAEDVLNHLNVPYTSINPEWYDWFRNTTGKIDSLNRLPSKQELIDILVYRYHLLKSTYEDLDVNLLNSSHPSEMMSSVLTNLDSWFAHHITTHIAIHAGNISVWKKLSEISVGGY